MPGLSRNKKIAIGVGLTAAVALILGLSIGLTRPDDVTTTIAPSTTTGAVGTTTSSTPDYKYRRVTCFPEGTRDGAITEETCGDRGCTFDPSDDPSVPPCYIPESGEHGFSSKGDKVDTPLGWKVPLKSRGRSLFGSPIENIVFEVEMRGNDILHFKIEDETSGRFKVPSEVLSLHLPTEKGSDPKYEVEIIANDTFAFSIKRKTTNTVIWESSGSSLAFADQFLQIATFLPSHNIYGFGENVHLSFRHDLNYQTWPAFSRDQASATPAGASNLYSVHPFYECVEEDGNTHGVFLLNSNAMEFELSPAPMLTYRTVGGILDFYVFMGPTPENVIQQYTNAIGKPVMPPYWALGFQLCRFNYTNTEDIRQAVNRTLSHDIPLDIQYADIDHMENRRDFTIDQENFGDLPEYFTQLQNDGFHTIIILDPALEINDTYEPYTAGRDADIFIKWPSKESMPPGDYEEYNRTDMMGYVWPDWKVVFPDFFLNETETVWTQLIKDFHPKLPFNGIWIDMNEPANFGTNEGIPWNWPEGRPDPWALNCSYSYLDDPPYPTKAAIQYDSESRKGRLSDKTICMVAKQGPGGIYDHYDVHSLYGISQTIATSKSIRAVFGEEKRSIIVTRSSYPGTGHYAGRWLGDNKSSWLDLRASIIGMLEFNLFGIPYIGADICGFFDDTTEELCKRWQQLGAFYPYSRNHNHESAKPQDPGYFGEAVAGPAREALRTRYTLLPYLYTLFHLANTQGGTVVRPLHHEFPTDQYTLGIDEQFLWGPAILFSPVLYEGADDLQYYLPDDIWYDYYEKEKGKEGPVNVTVNIVGDDSVTIHLRAGHIIPTQMYAINTNQSRTNPFGLKVPLKNGKASGLLFWDDGELVDSYEKGVYYLAAYSAQNISESKSVLQVTIEHNSGSLMDGLILDTIDIMGVPDLQDGYNYSLTVNNNIHNDFTYIEETQVIKVTNLKLAMTDSSKIEWTIESA